MLRFDRLVKHYGPVIALDGCSFSVARGQMLGFLGPNGAGKTTAMRGVFGLMHPDEGAITWDGESIDPPTRLRFGYMPEERGLYPRMNGRDQLEYFGQLHDMTPQDATEATTQLLEEFDLGDRVDEPVNNLSHGNQQRLQLAVALIHHPELLVLDEPFSGLDPLAASAMADVLRRRTEAGAAVLFSSHQLDLVEGLCDDVVIINKGAVVLAGDVMDLRAASPHRYLEIVSRSRIDWAESIEGTKVVDRTDKRIRLELTDSNRLSDLANEAEEAGDIVRFSVEPPTLSEVFEEAVT
jgi:ABC-2 type transport system ATP-binding protein